MTNPFYFWIFLLFNVPAGFIAGMRLKELSSSKAATTIPFKFLNKNPFQSIYFAVQSMAAELSTASLALLATKGNNSQVLTIIVGMKAEFLKKAIGKVTFLCEEGEKAFEAVEACMKTKTQITTTLKTTGYMKDGTIVSIFYFTWAFKEKK
ncbi:MAG: DUF4442 domain-containing protein [Chitinophagaceae bacterium]|nr:DUF4442 domain-containing protein [Chitinophagaceae bacterium]